MAERRRGSVRRALNRLAVHVHALPMQQIDKLSHGHLRGGELVEQQPSTIFA
jgi:hypothetical protein